jgi:hypothetical protein
MTADTHGDTQTESEAIRNQPGASAAVQTGGGGAETRGAADGPMGWARKIL